MVASTAPTISFSGVQCAATQCCAIILCTETNDLMGCNGISYTQTITQGTTAGGLAAGIIVAIVFGALAGVCAMAAYARRKYYNSAWLCVHPPCSSFLWTTTTPLTPSTHSPSAPFL